METKGEKRITSESKVGTDGSTVYNLNSDRPECFKLHVMTRNNSCQKPTNSAFEAAVTHRDRRLESYTEQRH